VLAGALTSAIVRRRLLPEWLVSLAGAALLVAVGAIGLAGTRRALADIGPTVGFLAALLVLAEGCRRQGVFEALGAYMSQRAVGRPRGLFALVFAASTAVTVVLGLDATVVLLTPIALVTAARLRVDPKPSVYACGHLANSASLLLPVSNLTNLLAFSTSRLSFARFALVMALPWAVAVAIEWIAMRSFFAPDLRTGVLAEQAPTAGPELAPATAYALIVLGLTLLGFGLSSLLSVAPVWFAVAGAALIVLPQLVIAGPRVARDLVSAVQPGFLVFVLALAVIVRAAAGNGLRSAVIALLPSGSTLPDLVLVALVAAAAANLLNNLPATLILVPVAGGLGLGPLLAVLVGVNVGPNLSYGGSLATLLWRRIIHPREVFVEVGEFTRLGVLTVLPALPAVAAALWLSVRLVG
jgi:arsenical pump membrane protein